MNISSTFLKKINLWNKVGLIFQLDKKSGYSHTSVPTAYKLKKNIIRIFFSSRNKNNESNIFFIDFNFKKKVVLNKKPQLVLKPGDDGLFDDSGVTPSYIIKYKNSYNMYYVGWRSGSKTRMSLFVGLAKSKNLKNFKKIGKCPILDRNNIDPFLTATLSILKKKNEFNMWYVSGDKWLRYRNESYPKYNIKFCTSKDGINWNRSNNIKINYLNNNEYAIARPSVQKINGIYCMWYCYKKLSSEYKIGFAYSKDNKKWKRADNLVNFLGKNQMWENKMKCYPYVFVENKKIFMLYNGNEYGKTGIGLAYIDLNEQK
jgi:predicted GH43/DUF377 family glycosyl hydrolase